MLGFDCNTKLTSGICKKFFDQGHLFVIRYVGRIQQATFDISKKEVETILNSGLQLGLVQHCKYPGWVPSYQLGKTYGQNAAKFASEVGYKEKCIVYLDLEGIKIGTPKQEVIDFCNVWYEEVAKKFTPGIYVGFDCILNGTDLYNKLKFQHYWAAFNAPATPIKRGFEMQQKLQKSMNGIQMDPNIVTGDKLGNKPIFMKKESIQSQIQPQSEKEPTLKEIFTKAKLDNVDEWVKFVESIIELANGKNDIGFLEKAKYLPDLIKKVSKINK